MRTQLLRIIERLSDGVIDASNIDIADIRSVTQILFQVLGDKRALLVFDNVDQYVDLETLELVKDLDILIAEAQSQNHNSFLLFTCRPDVRVDESRCFTMSLEGLAENEVQELVSAQGIHNSNRLATELHEITEGHPLWVNLILMQARRTREGLQREIEAVRSGGSTLPNTTRRIWDALNPEQRNILRTMAEMRRPETQSNLAGFLPGINFNRVNRALKALRAYHLVEHRFETGGEPLLDLHPIIREYIRTNYPKKDRARYVGAILEFLDSQILRFKDILPQSPTYEVMDHWIRKAELHITFERYEEATATIAEVGPSLTSRGYSEALVNISIRLLDQINWAEACSSFKDFDSVFQSALVAMIQFGHERVLEYLMQFEEAIPGKSAQFILLCDLRCYADWYVGNFPSAIEWGEKGAKLKRESAVDTQFSTQHNLALARRDAGLPEEALQSFLGDETLESVLAVSGLEDKGASFFGNIGRCLYFQKRYREALTCYVESARLLESESEPSRQLNRGYIRFWFGELLEVKGELELAALMYRAATDMWKKSSPPRQEDANARLRKLIKTEQSLDKYLEKPEWEIQSAYVTYLSQY